MTPADPLTPEEVERLYPETRRYYSGANSRDESMWPTVLIVSRAWLRDHIPRAARMEADVKFLLNELRKSGYRFAVDDDRAKRLTALAPTERSET